jgi:predicted ester cyclase
MGAAREHVERRLGQWNNGDLEGTHSLTADDAVWVSPTGRITGALAILDDDRRMLTAYPDRRLNVSEWFESGHTVVIEGELTGTHNGPLTLPDGSQLRPSGQQITIPCAAIYQVSDDKTIARRLYYDAMPVLMQLGVVAPTQPQG